MKRGADRQRADYKFGNWKAERRAVLDRCIRFAPLLVAEFGQASSGKHAADSRCRHADASGDLPLQHRTTLQLKRQHQ
jgi:hypothetical protein